MLITIGDLLRDKVFPDIEILTAPPAFENRPVALTSTQSIHEMPVADFIKENELVFSSSIGTNEEEPAYFRFIEQMQKSGVSAIVMAFQNTGYRPSEELLVHAAELQMPLFLIPWEHRFFEIQMTIAAKIRASAEQAFAELQTTLFNLYFDATPLKGAADKISEYLGIGVQITAIDKKVLAESQVADPQNTPQEIAVTLNETPVGYLLLFSNNGVELPHADTLGRYICFPLAMWFLHKNVEERTIARLKNDFIWNLANDRSISREELAYQSRQLQLDLSRGYTCLLLELIFDRSSEGQSNYVYAASNTQNSAQVLLEEIAERMGLQLMCSSYSSQSILYLEYRPGMNHSAEQFVEEAQSALEARFPTGKVFWGISESAEGPVNFAALYKHALQALSYALRSKKQRYRFSYHDTKEAQITSLLAENTVLRDEAVRVIGRLTNYSDSSGIDLLGTLQTYISCNYNISLTARNLFIHRQSLLYRLGKIEELTDMSLHDHRHLFLLEIYEHIYTGY